MISQQAQDAFDYTVSGALKTALCALPDDRCEVEVIGDIKEITEKKAVLLTVSSYLFRVMTLIYFTLNRDTKSHFAAINRAEAQSMSESDFLDVIGERGNIFCGALNRELAHHFPHLGMSTPNVIDRECVDYLTELGASYIKHFKVVINDTFTMHASLCVCDFADIDFAVDMTQAEESNGELELF
ncbi:MAG: hypothetical protein KGL90_07020 [Burkholderiales bacterium]|nr:hypothetical protein [Burkholderiales bacterium]